MFTKFHIEKFDGKISFSLWQLRICGILVQQGLFRALGGVFKKPESMSIAYLEDLDLRALTAIQLSLSNKVLRKIAKEETSAALWLKLESLYMTKSLTNKLHLKQQLYLLRIVEDRSLLLGFWFAVVRLISSSLPLVCCHRSLLTMAN